ncbi:SPASM domain-containing protein [Brachyspira pilosicoli]|uniref:Predicted glycosyltransferase n=1 Tax=Brachyspira pilosicoli (strain ATCC BAA-1826 / 95/1000) TaxID=759914 RepID=D8IAW6_BRAP9|nr:radical SAM protein [Brachyspira pilosicoli]ADK32310.1 predicted glycosyltransferase [Brachyspira pilosicoli 95/1000]
MDKNIEEIINRIAWWIPFKGLRNAFREYLLYNINLNTKLLKEIYNINKEYSDNNKEIFNNFYELKSLIFTLDLRNKARMQILALGDEKIIEEKRKERLIVSLTSFPQRIYDIDVVLFSLLNQTIKPDKIILWLSIEEFPNLEKDVPLHILNMRKFGIEIEFCNNLYSYNKLIHSLKKYPNDIIVTADDDIYYEYNWLEKLYNAYLENPNYIHCHRAHKVKFDDNNILEYKKWIQCLNNNGDLEASYRLFFNTSVGIICKKNMFYKDVLNEKLFIKKSPKSDDIWFWAMSVLNDTKINIVKDNMKKIIKLGCDNLYDTNVLENYNDIQLNNLFNYYGEKIKNKLIQIDNKLQICKLPFSYLEIDTNGDVRTCCLPYIKGLSIGNIFKQKFEEILNSDTAKYIRNNCLNEDYSMCNLKLCHPNKMENIYLLNSKYVDNTIYKQNLNKVNIIKFSYDNDCNINCKSCRTKIYRNSKEYINELDEKARKYFLPIIKYTDKVCLIGSGDPLASKHTRNFIKMIVESYPNIKFDLHTNGLLLNEKILMELNILDKLSYIQISMHAATKEVYDQIVLGGNFDILISNLEFIYKLKMEKKIEDIFLFFVVSKINLKDAKKFVLLAKKYSAQSFFWNLRDWGTEYSRESMVDEYDIYEVFKDKIFNDESVHLNPYISNIIKKYKNYNKYVF